MQHGLCVKFSFSGQESLREAVVKTLVSEGEYFARREVSGMCRIAQLHLHLQAARDERVLCSRLMRYAEALMPPR